VDLGISLDIDHIRTGLEFLEPLALELLGIKRFGHEHLNLSHLSFQNQTVIQEQPHRGATIQSGFEPNEVPIRTLEIGSRKGTPTSQEWQQRCGDQKLF
jgi:hypothetical protein